MRPGTRLGSCHLQLSLQPWVTGLLGGLIIYISSVTYRALSLLHWPIDSIFFCRSLLSTDILSTITLRHTIFFYPSSSVLLTPISNIDEARLPRARCRDDFRNGPIPTTESNRLIKVSYFLNHQDENISQFYQRQNFEE